MFNLHLFTSTVQVNFLDEFDTGMVGSPYAIAFDWVGRNMYIANQESAQVLYLICII